jgi:hypothetical protein
MSAVDSDMGVAQEYLDALKRVCAEADYQQLVPTMKRALKFNADKLAW